MALTVFPTTGSITQRYGENSTRDPAYRQSEAYRIYGDYQPGGHNAIDIGCAHRAPVVAAGPGTLDFSGRAVDMPGWVAVKYMHAFGELAAPSGNCALVDHGDGTGTGYYHLDEVTPILDGSSLYAGQQVGYGGNTGRSLGTHLHFEVILIPAPNDGGMYGRVDPLLYFPAGWSIPLGDGGEGSAATRRRLIHDVPDLYYP